MYKSGRRETSDKNIDEMKEQVLQLEKSINDVPENFSKINVEDLEAHNTQIDEIRLKAPLSQIAFETGPTLSVGQLLDPPGFSGIRGT